MDFLTQQEQAASGDKEAVAAPALEPFRPSGKHVAGHGRRGDTGSDCIGSLQPPGRGSSITQLEIMPQ